MIEPMQVIAVARLGQDHAVGASRQHRDEIGERLGALDRIDAHPDRQAARARRTGGEMRGDGLACERASFGRDGIFEIQDDGIGTAGLGFDEAIRAVPGHEQHRTHRLIPVAAPKGAIFRAPQGYTAGATCIVWTRQDPSAVKYTHA